MYVFILCVYILILIYIIRPLYRILIMSLSKDIFFSAMRNNNVVLREMMREFSDDMVAKITCTIDMVGFSLKENKKKEARTGDILPLNFGYKSGSEVVDRNLHLIFRLTIVLFDVSELNTPHGYGFFAAAYHIIHTAIVQATNLSHQSGTKQPGGYMNKVLMCVRELIKKNMPFDADIGKSG